MLPEEDPAQCKISRQFAWCSEIAGMILVFDFGILGGQPVNFYLISFS